MVRLGPVNACEIAFKIDEAMHVWKLLTQIVLSQDQKKKEQKVFEAGQKKKERKTCFKSEKKTAERVRIRHETHPDIRMPRLRVFEEHRDIWMTHL